MGSRQGSRQDNPPVSPLDSLPRAPPDSLPGNLLVDPQANPAGNQVRSLVDSLFADPQANPADNQQGSPLGNQQDSRRVSRHASPQDSLRDNLARNQRDNLLANLADSPLGPPRANPLGSPVVSLRDNQLVNQLVNLRDNLRGSQPASHLFRLGSRQASLRSPQGNQAGSQPRSPADSLSLGLPGALVGSQLLAPLASRREGHRRSQQYSPRLSQRSQQDSLRCSPHFNLRVNPAAATASRSSTLLFLCAVPTPAASPQAPPLLSQVDSPVGSPPRSRPRSLRFVLLTSSTTAHLSTWCPTYRPFLRCLSREFVMGPWRFLTRPLTND